VTAGSITQPGGPLFRTVPA